MLLPIIMICVCALLGGGAFLFLKLSDKKRASRNRDRDEAARITANEFVNVKDIRGKFLYTRDGLALCYLKILPISIDLFSKKMKAADRPTAHRQYVQRAVPPSNCWRCPARWTFRPFCRNYPRP